MPKLKPLEFWGSIAKIIVESPILYRIVENLGDTTGGFLVQKNLTLMNPPGPTPPGTYIKFFLYMIRGGEKVVLQCESRAVDAVPIDRDARTYYLVRRKDSGLLALPGGFIDPADGITNGQPIGVITHNAAARELHEETGVVGAPLVALGEPLREVLDLASGQKPREYITRTWPFAAWIPMAELQPADDVLPAEGADGLPLGWYHIDQPIPAGFHFAHHPTILKRAFQAAATGTYPHAKKAAAIHLPRDLHRLKRVAKEYQKLVLRDYELIAKGQPPLLAAVPGGGGFDFTFAGS